MRRVRVFKHTRTSLNESYKRVFDYEAKLLGFGVDYEEVEGGVGTYSTALVELESGEIQNVYVSLVELVKEEAVVGGIDIPVTSCRKKETLDLRDSREETRKALATIQGLRKAIIASIDVSTWQEAESILKDALEASGTT